MNLPAVAKRSHLWAQQPEAWYVEPISATKALLSVEQFEHDTWDPCCGQGNIVRTFLRSGRDAFGTDIVDRSDGSQKGIGWFRGTQDFLSDLPGPTLRASNIVMNPPFFRGAGAEAFIRRALEIATLKVAALVDIRFLAGDKRAGGLWADHPPHRVHVITPRISCPPGEYLAAGNKAGNGSSDYAWVVFEQFHNFNGTKLHWLRRESD